MILESLSALRLEEESKGHMSRGTTERWIQQSQALATSWSVLPVMLTSSSPGFQTAVIPRHTWKC